MAIFWCLAHGLSPVMAVWYQANKYAKYSCVINIRISLQIQFSGFKPLLIVEHNFVKNGVPHVQGLASMVVISSKQQQCTIFIPDTSVNIKYLANSEVLVDT